MLASLEHTYDWSQIIVAIVVVLGFVGTVSTFVGRRFVKWLDGKLAAIDKKATPNGGNTLDLGDTVARMETKQDWQGELLLYHLAHHDGGRAAPPLLAPPTPTRAAVEANNANDASGQHHYEPS